MLMRIGSLATAVFLAVLVVGVPAWAAPGDLDPSFGQGGHVRVQTNAGCPRGCVEFGGSYADAVALQSDGGIVLGGYNNYMGAPVSRSGQAPGALVRLRPDGTLDTSFGGAGGIEETPFAVERIDSNAHGGLAVVGSVEGGMLGLARYSPTGVLDGSFVPQGVRWTPEPKGSQEEQRDPQGRIVALATPTPFTIDVVRYLASGALDASFGHGGYAQLHLPKTRREAAQQPGTLGPPDAKPMALALQRNGSAIVAFAMASFNPGGSPPYGPPRYFLERLTAAGRVDRSFGRRGIARLPVGVSKIVVAPDGHILMVSAELPEGRQGREEPGRVRSRFASEDLVLVDYTRAGRPDRSFGKDGVARSRLTAESLWGIDSRAIAFDAAGDVIVVGELPKRTVDVPLGTGFLARYTPHGRDCSFGAGGVVIDDEVGGASAVAVQPNGRIVIAGWSQRAFMAARYMGGGTPRTCRSEPHWGGHGRQSTQNACSRLRPRSRTSREPSANCWNSSRGGARRAFADTLAFSRK
jgi:uncharacterized delta-60 repeat protein